MAPARASTRRCAAAGQDPPRPAAVERVLFALVANRALAPSSKLAAAGWVTQRRAHPRPARGHRRRLLPGDGLAASRSRPSWPRRCSPRSRTCSTSRSTCCSSTPPPPTSRPTTADEPVARDAHGASRTGHRSHRRTSRPTTDDRRCRGRRSGAVKRVGFRTYGKSKDHRDDLPQVVVGMAVTRDGIPVRVWCWPGNTSDSALIRQVKDDMRDWNLARVVWVADRGFTSAENRRYLQRAGGHYILGEKLRAGSAEATAALARQGRYPSVAEQPAGQGSPHRRPRTVRDLPQPRSRRPRRRRPRTGSSPGSTEMIDGTDKLTGDQARRAARGDLHQARAEPVPARHPRRAAAHRRAAITRRGRSWTASTCCAAPTRTSPPRTSRWATSNSSRSNAAGAT